MLLVIGSILMLVAAVFGLVILIGAFKESAGQGLLCMFVPFYIFYYAFARYSSPKKPIVVGGWAGSLALGMVLTVVGSYQAASATAEALEGSAGDWAAAAAPSEAGGDGAGEVAVDPLGLKADVPAGSSVGKAIIGDGAMITGPGFAVTIEEASATRPDSIAAAKSDIEIYSPKSVQEETLADGWALAFNNEGGSGENYFVHVRRDLGGKSYWCETTTPEVAGQASALQICKSLRV